MFIRQGRITGDRKREVTWKEEGERKEGRKEREGEDERE
jgi:hypothetical protein